MTATRALLIPILYVCEQERRGGREERREEEGEKDKGEGTGAEGRQWRREKEGHGVSRHLKHELGSRNRH